MRKILLFTVGLALAVAASSGLGIVAHADTKTVYQPRNFS
jgi:hypothetical protein